MSGDITPVKPKKYPNFFVLLGGLLTVLFLACCVISWMARPPADKNAAVPASVPTATLPPSYRILATQGIDNFVVVDPKVGSGRVTLKGIADTICKYQDICVVLFWDDESKAATGIPMTDAQVNAQIGHYNLNKNTGLDRMLICVNGDCNE